MLRLDQSLFSSFYTTFFISFHDHIDFCNCSLVFIYFLKQKKKNQDLFQSEKKQNTAMKCRTPLNTLPLYGCEHHLLELCNWTFEKYVTETPAMPGLFSISFCPPLPLLPKHTIIDNGKIKGNIKETSYQIQT